MIKLALICSWLLLGIALARAASHYFDNAATAGSNDGTSWANAWTNDASVNWASINPGDTIFISGGSTSKTYTEDFTIEEDGTPSDRIIVRIGQDEGHNGVADFGTNIISRGVATRFGITIDGHRGLNYSNPTNWLQVDADTWTNNAGFLFRDRATSDTSNVALPNFMYFTAGSGETTVRYIMVTGYTNTGSGFGSGLDERGVIFYGDFGGNRAITNFLFENIWLANNSGSSWRFNSATNEWHDGVIVQRSKIYLCGEDVFFFPKGATVRDNVVGPYLSDDNHMDLFQIESGYFRFYNNRVREVGHGMGRIQMRASSDPANPRVNHSTYIYNNIFDEKLGRGPQGGCWNEGIIFVNWDSDPANGGYGTWSNIWICNNTFYNSILSSNQTFTGAMMANPIIDWPKGGRVTNAYLKSINVLNNLIVSKHRGAGFPSTTNYGGVNALGVFVGYEPFTTNDFVLNFNVFAGYDTALIENPRRVGYLDYLENIESHPYQFLNTTNLPLFVDANGEDFELQAGDIAALNTGTNLSSVFTYDSLYRPRGTLWSRGAMESDAGLVLFYSFDNDAAGGNATDDTGNGYTGTRFVLSEYGFPSNRLASEVGGTLFRPNVSGYASDFKWRTNNGTYNPLYLDDGGFFGVTNAFLVLSNLQQFSAMCWARYESAARTDQSSPEWSDDGNATLISFGGTAFATPGSFDLGRLNQLVNQGETRLYIQTNTSASGSWGSYGDPVFGYSGKVVFNYPDVWAFADNGNTTNWCHYAFTFDSGIVTTYFNGLPVTTNDMSAAITAITLGRSGQRPFGWVGIGVNTHVGTPEFDNESGTDYPNHGWMNGGIDQPRIYNRALTHQEIVDVANSEGAEFADAPAGGGESGEAVTGARGIPIGIRLRK